MLLGKSFASTPPTTTASNSFCESASIICEAERPASAGSESIPHAAEISTRAAASVTGRPPGRRFPIAPASKAPRSPARRGMYAIFAPVLEARAATAENNPADSEARSPTRITDFGVRPRPATAELSAPGATFTNSALSLSIAIDCLVATAVTLSPRFLTFLLRRKKTIGDSSSGSKATSAT